MQVVSQETNTDVAAYTVERARAFGRSAPELNSLLGGFGLFLAGEASDTPFSDWIDDADTALIKDDPRIVHAQDNLYQVRRVGNPATEKYATEVSRSTEWTVLLEKFIAVVPVTNSAVSAA